MDLNFECKGKVKVSIVPYMEGIIKNFLEEVGTSTTATPAADHLFQVRNVKEAKLLPKEQAIHFYHTIAQLLFVSTRA